MRLNKKISSPIILFIVLICLCCYLSIASPYFLQWNNIRNILDHTSIQIILAIGMTFIIASGGIDLSVGSIVSLTGICMGIFMNYGLNTQTIILLGLIVGVLLGVTNGLIIQLTRINAFIITLGTYSVYRGLSLILSKGIPIYNFPKEFIFWGKGNIGTINPPIIITVLLAIAAIVLLRKTKWGQYILAMGGNEEALKRTGVRIWIYRITNYAFMGFASFLVALIMTARLGTAESNAGLSMELDSITAAIMGGTLTTGGKASLIGTIMACVLLGIIRNGLTLLSISSYYQEFIIGALLLVSVITVEIKERNSIRL